MTAMARPRAWVKPLASGRWQYFARCDAGGSVQGSAFSAWQAHDFVCDFMAAHGVAEEVWQLERKPATHRSASDTSDLS